MSRPIQALAPGFLSLLGLKNNGALPPDMVDAVAPTVDLLPFYLQGVREVIPQSAVTAINVIAQANYGFAELQVPAGQIWYVHGFTLAVNIPAGHSWTGTLQHLSRTLNPLRAGTVQAFPASTATIQSLNDFWAQSGDFLGLLTSGSTGAGPIQAFGCAAISRFTL